MSRTIANNKSNNIRNSNSDNSMNEMGTPPRNTIEHSVTATPNKSSLSNNNNNNNNNNNSNNNSIDEIGNNHAGRFTTDFAILSTLGSGSFGSVHKCQSRLDNCVYAIKAAKRPWKGNAGRDKALKEVYALAALSDVGNEVSLTQSSLALKKTRVRATTKLTFIIIFQSICNAARISHCQVPQRLDGGRPTLHPNGAVRHLLGEGPQAVAGADARYEPALHPPSRDAVGPGATAQVELGPS